MMDFITAPLVCGIVFFSFYKIFELFVRRRERTLMIEKLSENADASFIEKQLASMNSFKAAGSIFGALKAGALLTGIGLGLLVAYFIIASSNLTAGNWQDKQTMGVIYGGCIFLFGGISLLISFLVELKITQKKD